MDKSKIIERAIADRKKHSYRWFELQSIYPELTIDEIFCDVIGQCNSQRHKDAIALKKFWKRLGRKKP